MDELLEKIADYISNEVNTIREADDLLEKMSQLVLDKLEDDYNF